MNRISIFKYVVSFSVPLFVLLGVVFILGGTIYFAYSFVSNPIRQYGNVFGYYRRLYHATYCPYLKEGDRYYTKITKAVEYRVSRDGITTIAPFTVYAYRPRSSAGEEALRNISASVLLNGSPNVMYAEQSMMGTDGSSFTLRSNKPLKSGDLISFRVDYIQYGLHAVCQEELDAYKNLPDLVDDTRTKLVRERNVEYVYASPSYSVKYLIEVIFPQGYPWKTLESVQEMAIISLSSKPVDKDTMNKIAKVRVEDNKLRLEYKHNFRSAHGHYLLWRLPKMDKLNRYALSVAGAKANVAGN